jgi:hypothetical protein
MEEVEELSEVIGEIYDASLDPALWPVAFERASRYIGGSSISLTAQDLIARKSNLYFSAGMIRGSCSDTLMNMAR